MDVAQLTVATASLPTRCAMLASDRFVTMVPTRIALLPSAMFNLVYAPGTKQNRALRPGRYEFYLRQGWPSTRLPNGSYRIRVRAWDSRANEASASLPFAISNGVR